MPDINGVIVPSKYGYVEDLLIPSFRVKIIAHASPRWKGAGNQAAAAKLNLELSQRRARAVRKAVEDAFVKYMGNLVSVQFKEEIDMQSGALGVDDEAIGSSVTMKESGNNRYDNAPTRRRVDVVITLHKWVIGKAFSSKPPEYISTASKFWHVNVGMSAGAAFGVAGQLLSLRLTNDSTGVSMDAVVFSAGGGIKAALGASASIWGDPTGFSTDVPKTFDDFANALVRYTTLSFSLFIGYEKSYISFIGFGDDAQSIDVGGWSAGTVGLGGSVTAGSVQANYVPPSSEKIVGSDVAASHYTRTSQGKLEHRILFGTNQDSLDDLEQSYLDSVIGTAVATGHQMR